MGMLRFILKIPLFMFCFAGGRRILFSAATVIVLAVLFHHFGPQAFELSPLQKQIGNELVEKAVDNFPWNNDVGSVMMVADVEAWSPFFQDAIREKVTNYKSDGSRKFDILPDSFTSRVIKALGFKNNPGKLSNEEIKDIVNKMEADTLLLVRFTSRDYIENADTISGHLSCTFYTRGKADPTLVSVSAERKKDMGTLGSAMHYFRSMSSPHKLVWGILGVLLFPFLMAPVTLTVVNAQSAKANGFMIFVYALLLFAFEGILFSAPTGICQALIMCVWGIAIVWYLLRICDMLASPGFRRRMQVRGNR